MSRTFYGQQHLKVAIHQRDTAKSIADFRQALAVIIPLETGLSLTSTAKVIGISRSNTAKIRKNFFAIQEGKAQPSSGKKALRNRAHAPLSLEAKILDDVLSSASSGGVVIIPRLQPLIEKQLGRKICLATVYNMLHRHGWRKIAPDRIHPKGDVQAQVDWKKNSNKTWMK